MIVQSFVNRKAEIIKTVHCLKIANKSLVDYVNVPEFAEPLKLRKNFLWMKLSFLVMDFN